MNQGGGYKKQCESSDTVERSTVITRTPDSNSDGNYWSASPYFLEILIPIISSFLLLRRRDLFGRLLLNLDKNCFSALCPSLSKREHLLKWAQRGIMPSWMPCPMNISLTLDDVWKDGSLLCTLINSAVPGACPNPHRHRNKQPTHGQALAYKYFGLAPIFTNEDFDKDLTGNLEFMFFMYLTQLRTNISQFSSTYCSSDMKYTSSYIARGMGLVTGEQYKKCVFYLYPNLSENDTGVLVTIKGPYHAYGCITLPPFYILKTSSGGNKKKNAFYIEEDIKKLTVVKTQSEKRLFRTVTSAIIPFLRNAQRSPVTSKIRIEANKEPDRIKLTYIPQHSGVHIICIVTDGCHLQDSPFNVSVSESNVEEIQKETVVEKTGLPCDLIPEKSKLLNEIKLMNTIKSPLSSNRYFNKWTTNSQSEPNLFEKCNRINYQKFCRKFELYRSSFDERQELSLDSLEDEGFFTNNKIKLLKRNSKAFGRFTDSIQKVLKMVKHDEANRINNDSNNIREVAKMAKTIRNGTNTFNDQQQEKVRYFEEENTIKQLGGIAIIKKYNERNPITELVLNAPKQQNDNTVSVEMDEAVIKSNKSSLEDMVVSCNLTTEKLVIFERIPGVGSDSDVSGNIHSKQYRFNKIFEVQDPNKKGKLSVNSDKDARIDKAENNSFSTITGTEFEDDRNATAHSKKTITSESNNTSSNFSTECEVDKTKNAISEQSITVYSPKEISENKNMFTNEKIIRMKNITDKNDILRELNGKTSDAKRKFEGDQFNFNKSQQYSNAAVENFKGIDVWENRVDGGKIHEKDEKINSVKMKIFTFDNSINTQSENNLKIDHQRENTDHNYITKSLKFSTVKNQKEFFNNTPNNTESKKENLTDYNSQKLNIQHVTKIPLISVNSLRNRFDLSTNNQETVNISSTNTIKNPEFNTFSNDNRENMNLSLKQCVSGENMLANNFFVYSPTLESSKEHAGNYLGDGSSTVIKNKNLVKETEEEKTIETTQGDSTLTEHSKSVEPPVIIEENFIINSRTLSDNEDIENDSMTVTEINQKAVSDYEPEHLPLNWNKDISKLNGKPIVNSLIGSDEREETYKNNNAITILQETCAKSNLNKLEKSLDHLLDKVDNLIGNIELEEKSTKQQEVLKTNDNNKTINIDNDLNFLMNKINKLIDVTEAEEKRGSGQTIITEDSQDIDFIVKKPINENVIAEEHIMPTNSLNVEITNELSNSEIEDPCRVSSVLTMIQKFESPFTIPTEKEELFRRNTEGRSTYKSKPYLDKRDRFIAMEHMSKKGRNDQGLSKDDNFNLSIATKSSIIKIKSEPSTPSPRTLINRKGFFSTKSQSYPSYNELPDEPVCEFLDLTQKRNPMTTYIENDSEDENILMGNDNDNKTSTIYIVTERKETEIRKNIYRHSFCSPPTEKIREIYEPPVKEQFEKDPLSTTCVCDEETQNLVGKKQFEPASFSSIINKGRNDDEEIFPDVSGFLKENNRQNPHVDYPKDFSVSRRVSQIESLQSLLAQNNMYVTCQIHRSHPNIYFGESPQRKKTRKPWRKLKSFDANLLTASSETQNDTKASRYNVDDDNCTKFQSSDIIIKEKIPNAACNERPIEGKRPSRIIKSSGTQQAERRSQKAVSNCQINQEGLHEGTPSNSQLSLSHPNGFPSVKDLRSKFEKNAESIAIEDSTRNTKIKGKTRSLDPDKCSCLDSSEENLTSLKYFNPLINSTHRTNDHDRKNNIIKPLKHAKNIFSSIEFNANKNQSELPLMQRKDEKVKETPQPHVLKSTSQHHFNGGCKQDTTSPPQYSFIKTPEATNSIRSEKKTLQMVENDKGKTSERGYDASSCEKLNVIITEEFETVDVKNIMKNQFTKARNFFKELETNRSYIKICKLNSKRITKKRKKSIIGSSSLPKVLDKFPVQNIYKDVLGDKRGSFKGAANRVGVVNAMASVPVRYKYFDPDNPDTLPNLDIFHRIRRPKARKSLKSVFLVDY